MKFKTFVRILTNLYKNFKKKSLIVFFSDEATRLFPSSALLRDLNDPNARYNHATKRPSTVNSQRFLNHGMAGSRLLTPSGGHHGRALLSPNGRKQNDQFAFALV